MDFGFWICNLWMAASVAAIAYYGRSTYARGIDFVEQDLASRLRGLRGSTTHLRRLIHIWVAIATAVFFALWLGADSLLFAVMGLVFLGAGPWYLVARKARARREKLEDQLADALVSFSSAVRAGLSLAQSLEMLAKECPKPIQYEFQQIIAEYKLGKPLERTLTEAKERLHSENFILFAAALLASRESGGRLNETVDRIAKSVLELQRLERKVQSETAQARKSAVYMAIVPAVILLVYSQIDPENTVLLFTTFVGKLMLATAVLLNVVAYFWSVKILQPDI